MLAEAAVPEVLKGRLEFGNREQIEALAIIDRKIAEQEERTRRKLAGELREWVVHVEISGDVKVDGIWAVDAKEAMQIVRDDEIDFDSMDLEFNPYSAVERGSR